MGAMVPFPAATGPSIATINPFFMVLFRKLSGDYLIFEIIPSFISSTDFSPSISINIPFSL